MSKIDFLKVYNDYQDKLVQEFGGTRDSLFTRKFEEYELYMSEYGYSLYNIEEKDVDTILLTLKSNCHKLIEKLNKNFGNSFLYKKTMIAHGLSTMFLMVSRNIDFYKL